MSKNKQKNLGLPPQSSPRLLTDSTNPMPRVSRVSNPPTPSAAAAAANVSSNGDPSCSTSVYQSFRPVTRSMTRAPASVVASSGLKGGGSASTSTRKNVLDASFSVQSAALRPATVTRARTPHKVTTSAWKPLTQPVALSEGQKCASLTTTNLTAKRSRAASTPAAKDSTNHSASKANSIVLTGKKNRDEETTSQDDRSDAAVVSSPTKKLQRCKVPSDTCSKRVPSVRILGGMAPAQLPTGMAQTVTGKNSANVPAKVISACSNDVGPHASSLPAQQLQLDTAKNSSIITKSVNNEASQSQPFSAKVVNLPRPKLETDNQTMPSNVPMAMNPISGLAGVNAPKHLPKLQIGNVKNTSNVLSNPAVARALVIKQQQQLLQQYKLGSSQQQQQQQQGLYIKGPALPWSDETPPIEPLGTRCQLCKLDVAFRPQGDAGRDASAPPIVAVLACHHAFHSSCIAAVYGLVEPSQCIACVEAGPRQPKQEPSV